jgi:pyruvate formate lyase activating enzyme
MASGGGVTVSGGEPLLQVEFVTELFNLCKGLNLHTTVDTSGFVSLDMPDLTL